MFPYKSNAFHEVYSTTNVIKTRTLVPCIITVFLAALFAFTLIKYLEFYEAKILHRPKRERNHLSKE